MPPTWKLNMIQFQWPPPDVTHEGSPGLMPGGRSAGLMYRRKRVPYLALPGGILPDLSQGGGEGVHYHVTYPIMHLMLPTPVKKQMLRWQALKTLIPCPALMK